ncbi:hypothetical protein HH1059_23850 [Halorhodospira halochloris]|uniref:Uncharacterized protein n=1 Tax=Halorhodospira halochloris TaxID=1052 RepID=A0A2Z6EZV4_HALHR|nr:hypothetical protein HH1059_23850 [Halorhodospira halochloris]
MTYGGFLPVVDPDTTYRNTWIRFGRKVFWEINYLYWERGEKRSEIWGLSVGTALGYFF